MPASRTSAIQPDQFATFGQLLRFLRQRAGLTQRELSIAVGYSESQMSRLEQNQRAPDEAALAARFVPALHLEKEPEWVARLLQLGAASRAEGNPGEPAPATQAPPAPHNLPTQLTSFIGRGQELAEIQQLLTSEPNDSGAGMRLLTLTGHGGTGKTRLAVQAAAALLASFPDGVWWVELAPLTDPALIPQAVAAVLGLKEEPDRPLLATLVDHLRGKRVLLILDNCEHLIQASAQFADVVLRGCPRLHLLASSREMLGVAGERALLVPSLPTPDPRAAMSLEALRSYDAVRLFVARASTASPHFALTTENMDAVAQVCWRLDGIPLALELAAARLRMFPVEQLAVRLDDAFRLLTGGSRTALPRHQTLQALIDWSYDLLPEPEQKMLRRLAVFAGGWTLEAAEAVCAGDGLEAQAIAGLLGRLIDKSLVLVEVQAGSARYGLTETVRQYAQAKLAASGEAEAARDRHAAYYLAFAEAGAPLPFAPMPPAWLDRMERELDNLRAALAWCRSASGQARVGLRLAALATLFGFYHGYYRELQPWLEAALARPEAATYPYEHAVATFCLGFALGLQGEYAAAKIQFMQSLKLLRELGDRTWSTFALERLGWTAREQGDAATARAWLEEGLARAREFGYQGAVIAITGSLGEALTLQGDLGEAKSLLEENLQLARRTGNLNYIGWSLNHLGHVAQLEGRYAEALDLHTASLQPFRELGSGQVYLGHVWAHQSLGETYLAQGKGSRAASHLVEALDTARDLGNRAAIAWCLAGLAGAAAVDEDPERAAWLWGAAEALRQSMGVREAPASHATHERLKARAREQLGEAAFAAQWAAGEAAPLRAVVERALASKPGV